MVYRSLTKNKNTAAFVDIFRSLHVARSGVTVIVVRRSLTEIRNSGFRDRRSPLEIKERQSTVERIPLCLPYLLYFTYLLTELSHVSTIDRAGPLERRETVDHRPNLSMLTHTDNGLGSSSIVARCSVFCVQHSVLVARCSFLFARALSR